MDSFLPEKLLRNQQGQYLGFISVQRSWWILYFAMTGSSSFKPLVHLRSYLTLILGSKQWGRKSIEIEWDQVTWVLPGFSVGRNLPPNAGDIRDVGSIPGSGRSPGGGNGNALQYFCLENPMDRGAWRDIVPDGVAKSWTRLSVHAYAWITHHCSVACVCQVEKLMPLYSFLRVESILSLLQEHYLHYSEQLYSSYSKLIITSIKGYSVLFL